MAKMLLYMLFGGCLFLLATAGSWLLLQSKMDEVAERQANADGDTPAPHARPPGPAPVKDTGAVNMPVPIRGKPMTAEEIFRFGATVRNQQEALTRREEAVVKQQARLNLVQDDLDAEQRELEGLFSQIRESLENGERLLTTIQQRRAELDAEKQAAQKELDQFKKTQTEYANLEVDNIKQISRWFQSMPAENAAEYLRELSNDGNIASAIQLLGNIEERDAAKILVAMGDPALVVQLTERFKGLKRPAKKQRK